MRVRLARVKLRNIYKKLLNKLNNLPQTCYTLMGASTHALYGFMGQSGTVFSYWFDKSLLLKTANALNNRVIHSMSQYPLVVVTGPPGVGKTTLVKTLVNRLQNSKPCPTIDGFYTEEVRQGGARTGFDIVTIAGKRAALAFTKSGNDRRQLPMVGHYAVDIQSFEGLALPLLKESDCTKDILVIDEVGKMELMSSSFSRAISEQLESLQSGLLLTIPVAGRGRPLPVVERIRNHPQAVLVTLNRSNRSDMGVQDRLYSCLTSHIK